MKNDCTRFTFYYFILNTKIVHKYKKEGQVFKFFKNGRCNKKDDECRFVHPKICRKFNLFGPKIGNNKGCSVIQ